MSWTKKQLIDQAYAEIGLADYVFDLQPEDLEYALRILDTMVARWSGKGVKINYNLPSSPDSSSLDDESGIPDAATQAVYLNLALQLAPSNGKMPSADMRRNAKSASDDLSTFVSFIPERQYRSKTQAGEGNKPYRDTRRTFLPRPHIDCNSGNSSR